MYGNVAEVRRSTCGRTRALWDFVSPLGLGDIHGVLPASVSFDHGAARGRCAAMIRSRWLVKFCLAVSTAALAIVSAQSAVADDIMVTKAPAIPYSGPSGYNWTGFYAGGHFGVAWGSSNWTATPGISGSTNLFEQSIPSTKPEASSRDFKPAITTCSRTASSSAPRSTHHFQAIKISRNLHRRHLALYVTGARLAELQRDELAFGTARARIGYAPGSWLFYATGGFAWTYNQQSLTQLSAGKAVALSVAVGLGGRRRR